MSGNSIIDLGELSKPATVLIEKISDAVGGVFRPYQIVRVAKAEAEAERVRAESQIEISDLGRRAFYRFLEEETKKQKNMEDITQKALPELGDDSRPEQLEADWIMNFFDKCRLVSDEEMQGLWSRVLAGEANSPGTYSKRTVNFLSDLDKSDADLFTRLCGFGWMIGNLTPLVFNVNESIYNQQGIEFGSLIHLESIGLVQFNSLIEFARLKLPHVLQVFYYGQAVQLEIPKPSGNSLAIGQVVLTKVGQELAPICGSHPVEGFLEYVLEKWRKLDYIKDRKSEENGSLSASTSTDPPIGSEASPDSVVE